MFDAYVSPSKKHADVIIPWAHGDNAVAIDLIVQHIRSKIGQDDLRRIYGNLKVLSPNYQARAAAFAADILLFRGRSLQ